jgi:hypothetical protein
MKTFEDEYLNVQQIGDMTEYEENYKDYLEAKARKIGALKRLGEISAEVSVELDAVRKMNDITSHTAGKLDESQTKTGTAAVDDYMSKIKAGQDSYKAKTDYSGWGKAVKEAVADATKENVQKVAIVEIKE